MSRVPGDPCPAGNFCKTIIGPDPPGLQVRGVLAPGAGPVRPFVQCLSTRVAPCPAAGRHPAWGRAPRLRYAVTRHAHHATPLSPPAAVTCSAATAVWCGPPTARPRTSMTSACECLARVCLCVCVCVCVRAAK